jgi:hypothetical protein
MLAHRGCSAGARYTFREWYTRPAKWHGPENDNADRIPFVLRTCACGSDLADPLYDPAGSLQIEE